MLSGSGLPITFSLRNLKPQSLSIPLHCTILVHSNIWYSVVIPSCIARFSTQFLLKNLYTEYDEEQLFVKKGIFKTIRCAKIMYVNHQ